MYLHINLIFRKNLNFLTNQILEGFKKQLVLLFLFSFAFAALLLVSQINTLLQSSRGPWKIDFFIQCHI